MGSAWRAWSCRRSNPPYRQPAVRKVASSAIAVTQRISALGAEHRWQQALSVFAEARQRCLQLDAVSFRATMTACTRAREWQVASAIVAEMQNLRVAACAQSWATVVAAYANARQWPHALIALTNARGMGLPLEPFSCSAAAHAFAGAARWAEAVELLVELKQACGAPPDAACHNAVVSACRAAQQWAHALASALPMPANTSCRGGGSRGQVDALGASVAVRSCEAAVAPVWALRNALGLASYLSQRWAQEGGTPEAIRDTAHGVSLCTDVLRAYDASCSKGLEGCAVALERRIHMPVCQALGSLHGALPCDSQGRVPKTRRSARTSRKIRMRGKHGKLLAGPQISKEVLQLRIGNLVSQQANGPCPSLPFELSAAPPVTAVPMRAAMSALHIGIQGPFAYHGKLAWSASARKAVHFALQVTVGRKKRPPEEPTWPLLPAWVACSLFQRGQRRACGMQWAGARKGVVSLLRMDGEVEARGVPTSMRAAAASLSHGHFSPRTLNLMSSDHASNGARGRGSWQRSRHVTLSPRLSRTAGKQAAPFSVTPSPVHVSLWVSKS